MYKTTRLLTCINRFRLDSHGTLSAKQGARKRHREPFRALAGLLALGTAIAIMLVALQMNESQASNYKPVITQPKLQVIDYQIYALKKLRSIRQFQCAITLWNRESNWRTKARNGNHYGIVQGNSKYLKDAHGYQQIDWGLRYVKSRYGTDHGVPNVCAALAHSYAHWWY